MTSLRKSRVLHVTLHVVRTRMLHHAKVSDDAASCSRDHNKVLQGENNAGQPQASRISYANGSKGWIPKVHVATRENVGVKGFSLKRRCPRLLVKAKCSYLRYQNNYKSVKSHDFLFY